MVRNVDLISYLPPYLKTYKEQVSALQTENPEFILVWDGVNNCLYNHFISTADEYGISRYEKMMGITPIEGDTLESRRSRIQLKWINVLPYTMKVLVQRLNMLCGGSHYIISGNLYEDYTMTVTTYLEGVGQVDELNDLLNEMLPCNIVAHTINEIIGVTYTDTMHTGVISSTEIYQITSENH